MFGDMERPPLNRLYGYARVSTDDQDLTLQRDALIKAGCDPEWIYEEHGSGGRMDRKQLRNCIRSMRRGDRLMVWKLDRLGRTLTGVIETVEELTSEGIELVSLTEQIDTTSAMGRAFFQIALVFAELERALISERTKAGIAVAKERGARFGQPHKIKDNPKRMAVARGLVERGLENVTAAEAIAALNRADPNAKPITSPETWRRWVRQGCPGVDD